MLLVMDKDDERVHQETADHGARTDQLRQNPLRATHTKGPTTTLAKSSDNHSTTPRTIQNGSRSSGRSMGS